MGQFEDNCASTENKMGNDWKQGLCGCLGEPEVCLCGLCIPCCLVKQNADDLGNEGWLHLLLFCLFPCLPIFLQRSNARERYGIEGSTAGDAVCSFCCPELVMCQTGAEIKQRGDSK